MTNANARINYERQRYQAFREKLLLQDPDLDERTLADTLEGLTDFTDILAATIKAALKDERDAAALSFEIDDATVRRKRLQDRAAYRRQAVRDAMLNADIKNITRPSFTASLREAPPHVVVIDEKLIPQDYFELRPHLRKRDVLEALKDGVQINGAVLSNPGMSLTVRTR